MLDRHFKKKKKYYDTEEEAEQVHNKKATEFQNLDIPFTKTLKTIQGKTILIDEKDYEKAKQYRWTIRTFKDNHKIITFFYDKPNQRFVSVSYKKLILGIFQKKIVSL